MTFTDIKSEPYVFFSVVAGIVWAEYILVANTFAIVGNGNNTFIEFPVRFKPYSVAFRMFNGIHNEILNN